tara:strand:- start:285 stop:545 length:261 start_codon:yes stop_codon:yes gene_type:complete
MTIETFRSITTASQYHACFESAREKYVKRFIQCIKSQKRDVYNKLDNNNKMRATTTNNNKTHIQDTKNQIETLSIRPYAACAFSGT